MPHADLKPLLIDLEADNNATGGKQELDNSVQPERLNKEDNCYSLYWIHLPIHISYEFGYIGITKNFKQRMKDHKRNKKDTYFTRVIKKYGWDLLIKEVIKEQLTLKEALTLEEFYRPSQNIGWNNQKGGEIGVEPEWYSIKENREKHSLNTSIKTKEWIKTHDSKEKRSKRAKESWKVNKHKYDTKGSKNGRALFTEEEVKCIKCELLLQNIKTSDIAKKFNVNPQVVRDIKNEKYWKHVVCDSPSST